ncbi:hypothetical protein V2J09_003269 [Rumex salicifolius]
MKHVASAASDELDRECYSIIFEYSSNWILDTGCSYHMCPNTSYKAINSGTVLMGSDHGCETVDISTIRIQMHDGIVRTLMDVRHVPDLRKNVISLGCKLIGENRVLKVVSGSLLVMKGIRQKKLYHLVGNVSHDDTYSEESDELEHEEVHLENAQALQQQQQETLASTRSRRGYKLVQRNAYDLCIREKREEEKIIKSSSETRNTKERLFICEREE